MRTLAVICAAFGVLVLVTEGARPHRFRSALSLSLDFWLAAGLLKLSADAEWKAVMTAALIVIVRKINSYGLKLVEKEGSTAN